MRFQPGDSPDSNGQKLARIVTNPLHAIAWPFLAQAVLRIALAVPFFKSGLLKWTGFLQLSDSAIYLFSEEFMLHLPGGPYHYPAPEVMAFLSAIAEVCLPILLVLGLGTRLAATALLLMTLVIELTVPDGWPIHLTWAAMALSIITWGPGWLSLDHILKQWLSGKAEA